VTVAQQLITNEHVQEMVRNTILEEEGSVQSKLKEAIFEPKMTRSKLRQVMETGQMQASITLCSGIRFTVYLLTTTFCILLHLLAVVKVRLITGVLFIIAETVISESDIVSVN